MGNQKKKIQVGIEISEATPFPRREDFVTYFEYLTLNILFTKRKKWKV